MGTMENRSRFLKKILPMAKASLMVPAILVGILVLRYFVEKRVGPQKLEISEKATAVRVLKVRKMEVLPRVLAYGNVQPDSVWDAVAEVSGKVIEIHPDLKKGAFLPKDAVLIKIDPKDYEYIVTQIDAEIQTIKAQLDELQIREKNTEASLRIEQNTLDFAKKELERLRKLKDQNTVVSQSTVDKQEQSVLAYTQSIQNLNNTKNLFPAQRNLLLAKQSLAEAQLQSAKLNVERTQIVLPITGRVSEVHIEKFQFARQGELLIRIDSVARAEIPTQFAMDQGLHLIQPRPNINIFEHGFDAVTRQLGLKAIVRLYAGNLKIEWPAEILRFQDGIDPQTRTLGLIVAVDRPYDQAQVGIRPPLFKNLFVEVELSGQKRPDCLVVPRSALVQNTVFVVNAENRLEKRPVEVEFFQSNFVVLKPPSFQNRVKTGVEAGELLILSDLVPAIERMLLTPVDDPEILNLLVQETQGSVELK